MFKKVEDKHILNSKWTVNVESKSCFKPFGKHTYPGRNSETGEKVMVKISDYNVMIKDRNFKRAYAEWRDYKYAVAQEHRMHYIGKDHPHILQAYDVLHDDDERKSYLIMECPKDAITLSEYLKMHSAAVQSQERHRSWRVNSRLRETFSKEITRQIVSAVGCLHAHHIAHNAINMDNIFVCPNEARPNASMIPKNLINTSWNKLHQSPRSNRWTAPCVKLANFGRASLFDDSSRRVTLNDAEDIPELGYLWPNCNEGLKIMPGGAQDVWSIGILAQSLATVSTPVTFNDRTFNLAFKSKYTWSTEFFGNFLARAFKRKSNGWHRANIQELAGHIWLNHQSSRLPINGPENPAPGRDPLQPVVWWDQQRLYPAIDFHIPLERREQVVYEEDLDFLTLEEASMGYWGWYDSFGIEEMLPEWLTGAMGKSFGGSLMNGTFPSPQIAVYVTASCYLKEKINMATGKDAYMLPNSVELETEYMSTSRRSSDKAFLEEKIIDLF